jgi:hypothetical protein
MGLSHLLSTTLELVTLREAMLALGLFAGTFALSIAAISFILVKLPSTYFQQAHARKFWVERHPTVRWAGLIGKNLLGIVLLLLGILMSVPGVPGQGILTILLGIMLIDLPGKHRLEYKILSRPSVLEKINRLRHKFRKPPLLLD